MNRHMPLFIKIFSLAGLALLAACGGEVNVPGTGGTQPGAPTESTVIPGTAAPVSSTPTVNVTALPATSQPTESQTPAAQPTMVVITALPATSQPSGTNTSPTQMGNEPTATPGTVSTAAPGQDLVVTLADDGKTANLKVGQRFLLDLGEGYDWTPKVADQNIVSRVIGILVIRGAQGVYEAHAPGTTMLAATGDPTCRKTKPACAMPSRLFKVTVVVEP